MSNLIISENYLKEYSVVNKNVDMAILTPCIQDAQDLYIEDLLGTKLYNQILSEIGSNTVTTDNQTLIDNYVAKCLISYSLVEAIPKMHFRFVNKGIKVMTDPNSESADLQAVKYLVDKEKNNAEAWAERTTKFLKRYASTLYPLYYQNGYIDEKQPNGQNFTTGIYLGNEDDDCKKRYFY